MSVEKFQPKKVAPIQYLLQKLNSNSGTVVPGWGTTPLMVLLMLLLFLFLFIILQVANSTIVLEGMDIDWSILNHYAAPETQPSVNGQFSFTASGVALGLLVFAAGCVVFIAYGAATYPKDQQ